MKIDKDKPLPDHTKLKYDECCAFLILKERFPERYNILAISDKPDLQGVDIGIEVTIANDRKHQEALNNWVKAYNCNDEQKREHYIERMKQLGVSYTGGIQLWPGRIPSFKYIKEAVNIKMEKVKSGKYKRFREYELFVFTDTWLYEDLLREGIIFFESTHILEKECKLHIFEKKYYEMVDIDIYEQSERNIRARRMVEQAEESGQK